MVSFPSRKSGAMHHHRGPVTVSPTSLSPGHVLQFRQTPPPFVLCWCVHQFTQEVGKIATHDEMIVTLARSVGQAMLTFADHRSRWRLRQLASSSQRGATYQVR